MQTELVNINEPQDIENFLATAEQMGVSAIASLLDLEKQLTISGTEILAELRPQSEKANKMLALAEKINSVLFNILDKSGTDKIVQGGRVLQLVNNPESTEVTDIALVPDNYKRYIATFPGSEWSFIQELLGDKIKNVKTEVDKTAVKKAWKDSNNEVEIAGTKIVRTRKLKID
jgi:hypothetical protein